MAVPQAAPKASRGTGRAPVEIARRGPADSFAVPASDEDNFKRIQRGHETSTPAETARGNAANKKHLRSCSAAPNGAYILLNPSCMLMLVAVAVAAPQGTSMYSFEYIRLANEAIRWRWRSWPF